MALALPQVALKLGAAAARGLGRRRTAEALARRDLFLDTAVARELRWRIMTDLLRQPFRDGAREATEDGLAEAILAHPRVQELLVEAGRVAAARQDDPEFRERMTAALAGYAGTRAAAAEITTGLITLGTGAMAFQKATPGAIALGPVIAGSLAQSSAISSFPLGATAGGLWYGVFPAQASPFLVAGATAGVLGVAAIATAFAGIISDPLQRALGLHRRRLAALVDSLEGAFRRTDDAGFVAYDLYVARLLDLGDVLIGIMRGVRAERRTSPGYGQSAPAASAARIAAPCSSSRGGGRSRASSASEKRIGLRGLREPPISCTAPRATRLRLGEGLGHGVDRPGRHAGRLHRRQHLGPRQRADPRLQRRDHLGAVGEPAAVSAEAGVAVQRRARARRRAARTGRRCRRRSPAGRRRPRTPGRARCWDGRCPCAAAPRRRSGGWRPGWPAPRAGCRRARGRSTGRARCARAAAAPPAPRWCRRAR